MAKLSTAAPSTIPTSKRPVAPFWSLLSFVSLIIGLTCALSVSASTTWISFEREYEIRDIVCIADAFEYLPAEEATAEKPRTTAFYRLRVIHVWKGDPPDTLKLRAGHEKIFDPVRGSMSLTSACGGPSNFEIGQRYLVFASDNPYWGPAAGGRTRRLRGAAASLLKLRRTKGSGRSVVGNASHVPSISFRSLVRDLDHGDSLSQHHAINALGELGDSSGVALPALRRILGSTLSIYLRSSVCNVLRRWDRENRRARQAFLETFEDPDARVRLAAVETSNFANDKKAVNHILERLQDPDPSVRAAALHCAAPRLRREDPPIPKYIAALDDTSAIVRKAAVRSLQRSVDDSRVPSALEACLDDEDPDVAAAARRALGRR